MNKKRFIIIFMVFILFIVGCNKETSKKSVGEKFNIQLAKESAISYMQCLKDNDVDGANSLSTAELVASNKIQSISTMPVVSFALGDITETGTSAYIGFYCSRSNWQSPNADLDNINLKIVKEGKDYKVSEVKGENLKEVYNENDQLRSITRGMAESQLILRLKDLPLELYPKGVMPAIQKVKVPKNSFGAIGISYTGSNIAFSTTDGKNSFIGIALVQEESLTMADVSKSMAQGGAAGGASGGQEGGMSEDSLKRIFERPIATKVLSYDVLDGCKIQELIFNEEEGVLLALYTKGNDKGVGLKIYKNPSGDLMKMEFDKMFPMNKYSIEYEMATKTNLIINVVGVSGESNISQDVLGKYTIDLVKEEMKKM